MNTRNRKQIEPWPLIRKHPLDHLIQVEGLVEAHVGNFSVRIDYEEKPVDDGLHMSAICSVLYRGVHLDEKDLGFSLSTPQLLTYGEDYGYRPWASPEAAGSAFLSAFLKRLQRDGQIGERVQELDVAFLLHQSEENQ